MNQNNEIFWLSKNATNNTPLHWSDCILASENTPEGIFENFKKIKAQYSKEMAALQRNRAKHSAQSGNQSICINPSETKMLGQKTEDIIEQTLVDQFNKKGLKCKRQ